MNLIINNKIPELMKGYPTVSDKYNVTGGILEGDYPAHFGEVVAYGSTVGYFAAVNATATITYSTDVAGFILATNVKLAQDWPGTTVQVNPGEAFNLVINGFMAVELASTAVTTDVVPNGAVYVLANGGITTVSDTNKLANALPNVVFTGVIEQQGSKYFAEIYIK